MKSWSRFSRSRALLLILPCLASLGWISWRCHFDPKINYLPQDSSAQWIVAPTAFDPRAHINASIDATFRHDFVISGDLQSAVLRLRGAKRVVLSINKAPVAPPVNSNWKAVTTIDVLPLLHKGTNEIQARVFNSNAPPAFWLNLASGGATLLRTNAEWQVSCAGSVWVNAALASRAKTIGAGNAVEGGEPVARSIGEIWPIWIIFLLLSLALLALAKWWLRNTNTPTRAYLILLVIVVLWLLLYWNNARLMPFRIGFDQSAHADYIKFIQEHHRLPLPNQGFEMFQPPLYYALSAGVLSVFHLSIDQPGGVIVLRLLTTLFAVANILLVYLSLRVLFPDSVCGQLSGTLVAAFVPMQLYLSQFITNESLVASLISAAIFVALKIVDDTSTPAWQLVLLGAVVGLALLAKTTAILLVPALILALVLRRNPFAAFVAILSMLAGVAAICGWYYVWIWQHFGKPVVGNWDPLAGFSWWQDPGFHTASDYLRFGRSLARPLFSGVNSFADGIYSTFWGDALLGGVASFDRRPPWNYTLMTAGYWLAILPAVLLLLGFVTAIRRALRDSSAKLFLLVSFSLLLGLALLYMTIVVPSYAQIKAFYTSSMLIPLSVFFALGWSIISRQRLIAPVVALFLLVCAMNSFASMWVRPGAYQHAFAAVQWGGAGRNDRAIIEAKEASRFAVKDAATHRLISFLFNELGQPGAARDQAQDAIAMDSSDSKNHLQFAKVLAREGDVQSAIREGTKAIELGADNAEAYVSLAEWLLQSGLSADAAKLLRTGLASSPYKPDLHYLLGRAANESNDYVVAANQFGYVTSLAPSSKQARLQLRQALVALINSSSREGSLQQLITTMGDCVHELDELAWLLATHPDKTFRNGEEAVLLAQRGCELSGYKDAAVIATLAAAYAETGQFAEAIHEAKRALQLSQTARDDALTSLIESLLASFRQKEPFREMPATP